MRFAIFGATGPSGQQLIKESLSRGHKVVALVRSPEKITVKNDNLEVVKVDIFKSEELLPHLRGCDAVFSALGQLGLAFFSKVTFYEDTVQPIVKAMREAEVKRFVCITSWCTEYAPENPKFIEWFIKPFLIGQHLKSMAVMEKYLANECPDIIYTAVRPAQLVDGESKGLEVRGVDGQFVPNAPGRILRHDVAKFMIDSISTNQWDRKAVAVATG